MEGSNVLVIFLAMCFSFMFGVVGMLMFGSKMTWHYLVVKFSRGKKVLIFGKTKFGWQSFVAKKKEKSLIWKYDQTHLITTIDDERDVSRYLNVSVVFLDADKPARVIKLNDDVFYPEDFDPEVFNNILVRSQTRPSLDGTAEIKKILMAILILSVLIGFGIILIYLKVSSISTGGVI